MDTLEQEKKVGIKMGVKLLQQTPKYFSGGLVTTIQELFQNSLRAGASKIQVTTYVSEGGIGYCSVQDNGEGCDDVQKLLYFGESFYQNEEVVKQDPAGMGTMSLAPTLSIGPATITVNDGVKGESVQLTEEMFSEKHENPVKILDGGDSGVVIDFAVGTEDSWDDSLRNLLIAIKSVASAISPVDYPELEVTLNGEPVDSLYKKYNTLKSTADYEKHIEGVGTLFLSTYDMYRSVDPLYLAGTAINLSEGEGTNSIVFQPLDSQDTTGVYPMSACKKFSYTLFLKDASVVELELPQRRQTTAAGRKALEDLVDSHLKDILKIEGSYILGREGSLVKYNEDGTQDTCSLFTTSDRKSLILTSEASCVHFGKILDPTFRKDLLRGGIYVLDGAESETANRFRGPLTCVKVTEGDKARKFYSKEYEGVTYNFHRVEGLHARLDLPSGSHTISVQAAAAEYLEVGQGYEVTDTVRDVLVTADTLLNLRETLTLGQRVEGFNHTMWYEVPADVAREISQTAFPASKEDLLSSIDGFCDDLVDSPEMEEILRRMRWVTPGDFSLVFDVKSGEVVVSLKRPSN